MGEETKIIPTVGRLVYYKLDKNDVEEIINQRQKADNGCGQIFFGNPVNEGQIFPMIITDVWDDDLINGQVILDGNDSIWVGSTKLGQENGSWDWMPYQKGQAKRTEELENKINSTNRS